MYEEGIMKRILSSLLIAILVMVQLTPNIPLVYAQAARGEEVTYSVDKAYDADSKTTSITVKAQPSFDAITVDSITTPEGESISGSEVTYAATANGSYLFTIAYTSQTENDEETITSGSAVTVGSDVNVDHKTLDVMVEVTDFTEKKELLAGEGVEINSDNFPDPVFMEYVRQFDTGTKDGVLDQDELDKVEVVSGGNNDSLEFGSAVGIQYFTKLKELKIESENMTELNVSYNTELEELYIYEAPIKTLDLTKNAALKKLTIDNLTDTGKLKTLDLSCNENLIDLFLEYTKLTVLDLSNNPKLVNLYVRANQLKKLDVSSNVVLETLNCSENQLKELKVDKNSRLVELDAHNNQLKFIDLKSARLLESLSLDKNQLSELDLSENIALKFVSVPENQLMKLDVSCLDKLDYLSCEANQLTTMDISNNASLNGLALTRQQVYNTDIWIQNGNGYEFDMKKLVGAENLGYILEVENEDGPVVYNKDTGIITSSEKFNFIYQFDHQGIDSISSEKMDVLVNYAKLYSVNAIAEGNGSITPSGVTWLEEGMGQEYTITPEDGYRLDQLTVNGNEVDPQFTYTIKDIKSHQTIEAIFKSVEEDETPPKVEYYIFAEVRQLPGAKVDGGTISTPGVTTLEYGGSWKYVMTPDDGMKLSYIVVDGKRIEQIKDNSYLFENVKENHSIVACFEPKESVEQYTITATADENGTITPNGLTIVNKGANQEYTITPKDGCVINEIKVDGEIISPRYYFTFLGVTQNHEIEVTFKKSDDIAGPGEVSIDEKHFPDQVFRRYVRQFDNGIVNGILDKDELLAVTTMQIRLWRSPENSLWNLDGIGVFTELKELVFSVPESDLGNEYLASIHMDLSLNTKLEKLDLAKKSWSRFNLENNVNLKELYGVGGVTHVDLSANTALEKLTCFSDNLSTINLSKNIELKHLSIVGGASQKLTQLDLSQNADLEELTINAMYGASELAELDLQKNVALKKFTIINSKLTKLDLHNNTALEKVELSGNKILKTINVDNITNLQELICKSADQLTNLNLSTNAGLKKLVLSDTAINTIDVSNNLELEEFNCVNWNSNLTKVVLGENEKLKVLTVSTSNTDLSSINLEGCTGLEVLDLQGIVGLKTVDVSRIPNLKKLSCDGTGIQKLDVTKNNDLEYLSCSLTNIRTLNLLNNKKLTYLDASRTKLKELNLTENTLLETLVIDSADLSVLDVSNCTELDVIMCMENKLTRLDVRKNTKLVSLHCDQNQLTKLDVSKNINLKGFSCVGNQLTKLELNNNVALFVSAP